MSTAERDAQLAFYDTSLSEGVNDAERVGWSAGVGQLARFEGLLQVIPDEAYGPGVRLLDVGCGLGDLWTWLKKTGRPVDYLGIDLNPKMIEEARRRHPDARFEVADLMEMDGAFELVVCSGALGVRFGSEAESWAFIDHLFALCTRAAAFNLLVRTAVGGGADLRTEYWSVEPGEAYGLLRRVSSCLVVREDVLPTDLIVYLYKEFRPVLSRRFREVVGRAEVADLHVAWGDGEPALAALAAPARGPVDVAREASIRGVALAQVGRFEEAIVALTEAHHAHPADLDTAAGLLHLLGREGRLDDGLAVVWACTAVTGASVRRKDWLRSLIHSQLLGARRLDEARQVEASAEGEHGRALMVGRRLFAEGDLPGAAETLEAAHMLVPNDLRAQVLLARVAFKRGLLEEALGLAAAVLSIEPEQHDARGVALLALQSLGQADRDVRRESLGRYANHPFLGRLVARMLR